MKITVISLTLGFLLIISLAVAAVDTLTLENCGRLGLNCTGLKSGNLTKEQEKAWVLIMYLLKSEEDAPYFGALDKWNKELVIDEKPYNLTSKSKDTILDAWVNITSLLPSVLYNGTIYVNNTGIIRTDYGYSLVLPPALGPANPNERKCGGPGGINQYGDCRTEYPENWDESYFEIYSNSNKIGNEKLAYFIASNEDIFESKLFVRNRIQTDHWKWHSTDECCKTCCSGSGESRSCWCCASYYLCEFDSSNMDRVDFLDISDKEFAKKEKTINAIPQIKFDATKDPAKGYLEINKEGVQNYKVNFKDSSLEYSFLGYKVNYEYPPYNILKISAFDEAWPLPANVYIESSKITEGTHKVVFDILLDRLFNCSSNVRTFFNNFNKDCQVTYMKNSTIILKTDKLRYKGGETINLDIQFESNNQPVSAVIEVGYGKNVKRLDVNGFATTNFVADKDYNMVYANFKTDMEHAGASASKSILVSRPIHFSLFFYALVLITLILIVRKKLTQTKL